MFFVPPALGFEPPVGGCPGSSTFNWRSLGLITQRTLVRIPEQEEKTSHVILLVETQ